MPSLHTISTVVSVLNQEVGWYWPVLLTNSLRDSKAVFAKTHWAGTGAEPGEGTYLKRFASACSIYLHLKRRVEQDRAVAALERILMPISLTLLHQRLDSLDLSDLAGMERLMAFHHSIETSDEGRFSSRQYVAVDDSTCHYVTKRCLVGEFFTEAGAPELMKVSCKVDENFFPKYFPEFDFSRGDSWQNTIAYGKPHCEFVFKKKR